MIKIRKRTGNLKDKEIRLWQQLYIKETKFRIGIGGRKKEHIFHGSQVLGKWKAIKVYEDLK
jgi:hypothetical protein